MEGGDGGRDMGINVYRYGRAAISLCVFLPRADLPMRFFLSFS